MTCLWSSVYPQHCKSSASLLAFSMPSQDDFCSNIVETQCPSVNELSLALACTNPMQWFFCVLAKTANSNSAQILASQNISKDLEILTEIVDHINTMIPNNFLMFVQKPIRFTIYATLIHWFKETVEQVRKKSYDYLLLFFERIGCHILGTPSGIE